MEIGSVLFVTCKVLYYLHCKNKEIIYFISIMIYIKLLMYKIQINNYVEIVLQKRGIRVYSYVNVVLPSRKTY